jgi:hypothetical protein
MNGKRQQTSRIDARFPFNAPAPAAAPTKPSPARPRYQDVHGIPLEFRVFGAHS